MNDKAFAATRMSTLLWVMAGLLAGGLLMFAAYKVGEVLECREWESKISKMQEQHANELTKQTQHTRDQERRHAQDLVDIDHDYQAKIENDKQIIDSTIAALRAGTIRMRKQLAAPTATDTTLPQTNASTCQRDAGEATGLQPTDAEFLIRFAADADAITEQLTACQAVILADRKGDAPQATLHP